MYLLFTNAASRDSVVVFIGLFILMVAHLLVSKDILLVG